MPIALYVIFATGKLFPYTTYILNLLRPIEPIEATAESLGLLISNSCVFTAHIRRVRDKIKTMVYQVRRNFTNLNQKILGMIYGIYIQSRIDYCSPVYNPGVEHLLRPIEKIVKTYWKLGPNGRPPENFVSPQLRMIQTDLRLVHKMYKGESTLNFEDIFKTNREVEKDFKTRQEEQKIMPIPKWRLQISRQKFSFRTRFYWNFLPLRIRELKTTLFKKELLKYLLANKQAFLNFGRNYNIVGEEDNKEDLLKQMQASNWKEKKDSKKLKGATGEKLAKKFVEKKEIKNPYLRKTGGKLTKITQPRLLLMRAPPAAKENDEDVT